MTAGIEPTPVVWAAVLCAALALLAAQGRADTRRRARRILPGAASPEPWSEYGPERHGERDGPPVGDSGGRLLGRLREAAARGCAAPLARRIAERLHRWLDRSVGRRLAGRIRGERLSDRQRSPGIGPEVLCLPVGGVVALLTSSALPVIAGAGAVPLAGRALRRRREQAAAERGSAAVSALCGTLAGDLRAGRPPHTALAEAVESAGWPASPDLTEAARLLLSAARFGGDVPHALREASRLGAGTHGLAAVAACWQVAVDGGAGLAAALDRVAAALRADADQRDDLRAQLAGPRSTAVLLALLPVFGVVLGAGLGADPSTVLLHTPAGLLCLVAGGCLEWAGLAWTARIIRSAEGGPAADRTQKASPAGARERGRL